MTTHYDDFGPCLLVDAKGPVRILTMNAPERLNTLADDLHDAIRLVWARLAEDDEVGAVVLTGAGRAFSAGGYVPNFLRNCDDVQARQRDIRNAELLARAMIDTEVPIVAAVNGPAIGLGASLAVMCDIVVMADDAYMSDPHVNVGLVAGDGGPVSWPLHIGLLRAKELILLGDRLAAPDCERLGLANRVVPGDALLDEAIGLAERLAAQPRQALRETKRALNLHLRDAADSILGFALAAESQSFGLPEVRELALQFTGKKASK